MAEWKRDDQMYLTNLHQLVVGNDPNTHYNLPNFLNSSISLKGYPNVHSHSCNHLLRSPNKRTSKTKEFYLQQYTLKTKLLEWRLKEQEKQNYITNATLDKKYRNKMETSFCPKIYNIIYLKETTSVNLFLFYDNQTIKRNT